MLAFMSGRPTYRLLSKGDPDKVVLVEIEEREGVSYAWFSMRALLPGRTLRPLVNSRSHPVPEVLARASEWVRPDVPMRIYLADGAKWNEVWGNLEGAGDHPSLAPLTVAEIVEHGRQTILNYVGATITGAEVYKNAIGLTLMRADGSLTALMIRSGPDEGKPGWLDPGDFVLSEFVPPAPADPKNIRINGEDEDGG